MRRQSTGRPGTAIIPHDWTDTHGDVISGTWTAVGTLTRKGVGETYDPDLGYSVPNSPTTLYTGHARIQARPIGADAQDQGGQMMTTLGYLVVVPRSVDAEVDDVWTTTDADDEHLIGRTLRVESIAYGSLAWERDLWCFDDLG